MNFDEIRIGTFYFRKICQMPAMFSRALAEPYNKASCILVFGQPFKRKQTPTKEYSERSLTLKHRVIVG